MACWWLPLRAVSWWLNRNRFEPLSFGDQRITTRRHAGLAVDGAGNIYVATDNGLVTRPVRGEVRLTRTLTVPETDRRIYSVFRDDDGRIWCGCGTRLCQVDQGRIRVTAPELPPQSWRSIRRDHRGNLWVLSEESVWRRKAGDAKFEPMPPLPSNEANPFAPFLEDPILSVAWNGDVIVASRSGISRWENGHWNQLDQRTGLTAATS